VSSYCLETVQNACTASYDSVYVLKHITINQTANDGVAHSKNPRKSAYHVTFDLDLEHTLDAGLPGDHRVQVFW